MTTIEPSDLYSLISLVDSSLLFAVYVTGLVMSLLRWNEGMAPRLAAIGFGLHIAAAATFQFMFRVVTALADGDSVFYMLAATTSFATLLSIVGWGLLIVALRR